MQHFDTIVLCAIFFVLWSLHRYSWRQARDLKELREENKELREENKELHTKFQDTILRMDRRILRMDRRRKFTGLALVLKVAYFVAHFLIGHSIQEGSWLQVENIVILIAVFAIPIFVWWRLFKVPKAELSDARSEKVSSRIEAVQKKHQSKLRKIQNTLREIKLEGWLTWLLAATALIVSLVALVVSLASPVSYSHPSPNTDSLEVVLKTFSGRMDAALSKMNTHTETLATNTNDLKKDLSGLNEQMKRLNRCVMKITTDIGSIRQALEKNKTGAAAAKSSESDGR